MPLNTSITRNGELLRLHWGDFYIAAMALAASFDDDTCENGFNSPSKVYETDPRTFECYPDAPFPIQGDVAFMMASYPMIGRTPLNEGSYTLTKRHKFIDTVDGEVLELLPGDVLNAWR